MTLDSLGQHSLDFIFHTSWFLFYLTYVMVSYFLFSVEISCPFVFLKHPLPAPTQHGPGKQSG